MRQVWLLPLAVVLLVVPSFAEADTAADIVRPLREIGHVRATSSFCKAFASGAAPAARAALAYENRLALTLGDLAHFDASDELAKRRGIALLEDDLRALAGASKDGRGELSALRTAALASGTASDGAVVDFADALDGAKGRQMELARGIARIVGTLSERDAFSVVNTESDAHAADPFAGKFTPSRSALLDGTQSSAAVENVFFTAPGDDAIGRDLARAVEHATTVESLEHCR